MPWKAPFKDKSRVGIGTAVTATEGSSGASTGGQSIAGGKKVAKSDGKIGGKVKKVPKVAKKKENSSKKVARPKPKIDGLSFSGSPVKMKKVSLRGKTQKTTTPGRSFISDCEEEEEEEEEGGLAESKGRIAQGRILLPKLSSIWSAMTWMTWCPVEVWLFRKRTSGWVKAR